VELSGQLHALAALPRVNSPQHTMDRKLVRPRAGVDAVAKRKNPITAYAANWTPVVQPVA